MRATLPDGTEVEVLAKLVLPLPLSHADLLAAIGRAAERLVYTEVSWIYDGRHAVCVAGIRPDPDLIDPHT